MPPQQNKPAPDFIPAQPDFIPADQPTAETPPADAPATDWLSRVTGQKTEPMLERALAPSMHSADQGVIGNAITGAGNFLKGGAHMLTHPEELVTGAVESSPPVQFAKDMRDAYRHIKGEPNANDEMAAHPAENLEYAAGEAAPLMLAGGADALPSKVRAAGNLQRVMETVGDKPVSLTRTMPELETAQKLSLWKHGNIPALDDLYSRVNTVNPLSFEEAKGRYEPISKLTASDRMNTTGKLQGQTKTLAHAMRSDLVDAAENAQPGMGDLFDQGMSEYRNAARNTEIAKRVGKWGGAAAAGALGLEGAHRLVKAFGQ